MPLPDLLPIQPFTRPARGEVRIPGSKSLTNRNLLLAALCEGPTVLSGALFSEDTDLMAVALQKLGFAVTQDKTRDLIRVEGRGGKIPASGAKLFVGLAGTAARFLTALCAAAPAGIYTLDGVPQIRKRPMRGLIDALRHLGADVRCLGEDGFFPLEIHARGLSGGLVSIDAAESSQMLSALLMVAPLARPGADVAHKTVTVELSRPVREPFVEMTLHLMRQFGIEVVRNQGKLQVPLRPYRLASPVDQKSGGKIHLIEPDATAASYFMALPLVTGGRVTLLNVTRESLQGDIRFEEVLKRAGLSTKVDSANLVASYEAGPRPAIEQDFRDFSDTFLTLAAISPLLEGPTRITGIAHTRKQETDRVEAMAAELRKIVGKDQVSTTDDSLSIIPGGPSAIRERASREPEGLITIDTYNDHRVAMSFAILGCCDLKGDGHPWLAIRNPSCSAKTFPNFFELLEALRQNSSLG